MLMLDAVVACIVIKLFSIDALMALGATCMISFIRVLPDIKRIMKVLEMSEIEYIENNKEEK